MDININPTTLLAVGAAGALLYNCMNKDEKKDETKPNVVGGKKSKRKSAKKSRRKSAKKSKRKSAKKSRRKSAKKSKRKSAKKSRRKSAKKSKRKPAKKSKKKSVRKSTTKVKANSKLGCVDLCKKGTASQQKKYCNRNSPPYPGAVCLAAGKTGMRGNDGEYYINKSGRWVKQK